MPSVGIKREFYLYLFISLRFRASGMRRRVFWYIRNVLFLVCKYGGSSFPETSVHFYRTQKTIIFIFAIVKNYYLFIYYNFHEGL